MTEDDAIDDVLRLASSVWRTHTTSTDIRNWLDNFVGSHLSMELERMNALHLLFQFMYFGHQELRVLLRALYRDRFLYPIIQDARARVGDPRDVTAIAQLVEAEVAATRFLGMGNPSESGVHLLYYFRQENRLSKKLFVNHHELFDGPTSDPATRIAIPNLKRVVFIDDLLGSGSQARQYSATLLQDLRAVAAKSSRTVDISYLVLFAKESGLTVARGQAFDRVDAVHVLDESQNAFSTTSRAYPQPDAELNAPNGRAISAGYGSSLYPSHPLGYKDGEMLLGFHHNIPDNTLPIFWANDRVETWTTIFDRYAKEVAVP